MEKAGVGVSWAFGYDAVATHDFASANDRVAKLAEAHPDRIVPVGLVNPSRAFPDVEHLLADGFRAIKILTGWGNWLTIDNIRRWVIPIAKYLEEHSCHLSIALEGVYPNRGGSVYLPLLIRESCPEVCLVLDRCWSAVAWEDYLTIAREDPSLWITVHTLPQRLLERIIAELGTARLLAGTWYPETDMDLVLEPLRRATGPDVDWDTLLRRNAERVLEGLPPLA